MDWTEGRPARSAYLSELLMECTWFIDDKPCRESARVYANLPLCDIHIEEYRSRQRRNVAGLVNQSLNHHPIESFPGFCYFVLLSDGSLKIGYSNTKELLRARFKELARKTGGPVLPLAILPGGFAAEAIYHERFSEYRLPGNGERFRLSDEIITFLTDEVGLPVNTDDPD